FLRQFLYQLRSLNNYGFRATKNSNNQQTFNNPKFLKQSITSEILNVKRKPQINNDEIVAIHHSQTIEIQKLLQEQKSIVRQVQQQIMLLNKLRVIVFNLSVKMLKYRLKRQEEGKKVLRILFNFYLNIYPSKFRDIFEEWFNFHNIQSSPISLQFIQNYDQDSSCSFQSMNFLNMFTQQMS
ncbi:hypothetical protein pb186bvf_007009, partial [Paramecium bursaria]